MGRGFDSILDDCLDRLIRGESIEQCLARYPEEAAELEPFLRLALAIERASSIEPGPDFKAAARYRFRSALSDRERRRERPRFRLKWQWAFPIAALLLLFIASGSTVAASTNSMPDEPLYQVKITVEQVRLWLTPTDIGRAKLHARFADRRVQEIEQMVQKDRPDLVAELVDRLVNHLESIALVAGAKPGGTVLGGPPFRGGEDMSGLRQIVLQNAGENLAILQDLEVDSPALSPILERAREVYLETLQVIEGGEEQ